MYLLYLIYLLHLWHFATLQRQHRKYAVQLTQRVFVESDTVRNCRNYPYDGFSSYKACDDHFLKQSLNSLAPGLLPVWLADDLDKVTTSMVKPQTLKGRLMLNIENVQFLFIHSLHSTHRQSQNPLNAFQGLSKAFVNIWDGKCSKIT